VGHDKAPLSEMGSADAASRKYERFNFVAARFQVRRHQIECHSDEPSNVFTKHPSGPDLAYDPKHFRPEMTVVVNAAPLPNVTEWLAGESSAEKGNRTCVGLAVERMYVLHYRHTRPMIRQHLTAERIFLTHRHGAKSCPLGGEIDPADPGKQGDMQRFHATPSADNASCPN
jgi:hypothetical protein